VQIDLYDIVDSLKIWIETRWDSI